MSAPSDDDHFTAEEVLATIKELSVADRRRLFKLLDYEPAHSQEVGYVVLSKAIFDLLQEHQKKIIEMHGKSLALLAKLGNESVHRNRRSSPETIRRNVEICDLRKQNPSKWSYGRLGKKVGLTKQAIKKILDEEV